MDYFKIHYNNIVIESYGYLSNAYDILVADLNSFVKFFAKAIELFYNLKQFINPKFNKTLYPNLFNF